ncbi:MAG: hypothetical protein KGI06_00715 [Candidatus Micrarchaeota archaeon]|nr:hypothetical protein [Candidatus Micrarchaeota archaeon]
MIPILQLESVAITTITFILTLVLTLFLTRSYLRGRKASSLFWSLGMWAFAIGVLLEILFAIGIYSEFLMASYIFIVAILVELLALGSIQLVNSRRIKLAYYAFCAASTAFMLYSVIVSRFANLVVSYIVYGLPPLLTVYASSFITFPAAAILVIVALSGYLKGKSYRHLSIIAGVILVSIAGTLYIAAFPSMLYIAEFLGILLLWVGFFRPKG